LLAGVLKGNQVMVADVLPGRADAIATMLGAVAASNEEVTDHADIIILAVKPRDMSDVLEEISSKVTYRKLLISIAAGITTKRIEEELGGEPRVVRVMPNTPAIVGAGAAVLCKGDYASTQDLDTAEELLSSVAVTLRTDESLLDAVTALSGSGPAYVFLVAESMIRAGMAAGLSEDVASKLTIQTIYGAGKMLKESGEAPAVLRRNVTSPGGTTEAALKVMTDRKLADIFAEAIQAAARRSKELSAT
jgi:pyrroline-5-carboxylate reductase